MRSLIGLTAGAVLLAAGSAAAQGAAPRGSAHEPGRSVEHGVVVWRGAGDSASRSVQRDVRVWRGEAPQAAVGQALAGGAPAAIVRQRTVIVYCGASRRDRLRTQGFYSGHPLGPMPRFSQGFYSGAPERMRGCSATVVE